MAEGYAFRERPPTALELTRIVLALSTYRDGSGQIVAAKRNQPGWRDFERATASALGGVCPENKGIFDVLIRTDAPRPYGLSLKTSVQKRDFVLMELHNSYAKAWACLNGLGIDPRVDPSRAGAALIQQVEEWHREKRDEVDIERSSYVVLTHDRAWKKFQLSWFALPLNRPDPATMYWESTGKRIRATLDGHQYWEWYGESGGQLKYYPRLTDALWVSDDFELRDPPTEDTPVAKARRYWPDEFPD
jgi:hypothetical protein